MPRVAADVPADASILCEGCGYTLDGLPPGANCPECGKPVVESTTADGRHRPTWETGEPPLFAGFIGTTIEVIVRPSLFFRSLVTRGGAQRAQHFAVIHWALSSLLFTAAACAHWTWYARYLSPGSQVPLVLWTPMLTLTFGFLWATTRFAATLTTWEARYRGIRLPRSAVLRGLYFHAAHYLPVAGVAFLTTVANAILYSRHLTYSAYAYLIVLCAEVVLAAGYLFKTYWAAMRNIMYANR